MTIDYMSKWVEVYITLTNDHMIVIIKYNIFSRLSKSSDMLWWKEFYKFLGKNIQFIKNNSTKSQGMVAQII